MAAVAHEIHTNRIVIPSDSDFEEGQEFLPSVELADLGYQLIARHPELAHLERHPIAYAWRREGGSSGGAARLGQCRLLSGYARYISESEFLITLSADHCRAFALTTRQLEALLFHELCHAAEDPKTGKSKLRPHDLEVFVAEIEHYGLWTAELRDASDTFRQATLPMGLVPYGGKA